MTAPKLRLVQQRGERAADKPARKSVSRKKSEATETAAAGAELLAHAEGAASSSPALPTPKSASAATRKRRKPDLCARDVMTTPARRCQPHDTLNDAAKLLWEYNLGALVVVDAEQKPISMITDRDICFAAYTQGVALWSSHVATAMATNVVVCHEDDSLEQVRSRMREAKVRRLPVVDSAGVLVGIVGIADLCRPKSDHKAATASATEMLQLLSAWVAPQPPSAALTPQ